MSVIYLGLPLWYWILMGIGVVFILITEILGEFRCYDLWVDGEFYRGCTYRHHPRNNELEIWTPSHNLRIVQRYKCFVSYGYWSWKKPSEEFYEKLKRLSEVKSDEME